MAHARKLTPETLALIKSAPMPSDVERLLSHVTALEEELKGCKDIQGVYYATMTSLEKKARALEEELKAAQDKMLAQVSVMKQHGANEVNDFRAQLVEAIEEAFPTEGDYGPLPRDRFEKAMAERYSRAEWHERI